LKYESFSWHLINQRDEKVYFTRLTMQLKGLKKSLYTQGETK